jgi:hypothetical protein
MSHYVTIYTTLRNARVTNAMSIGRFLYVSVKINYNVWGL